MTQVDDAIDASATGLAYALDQIGDRWTLLTVAALLDGPRRFGELQLAVKGIATNVLSTRLRTLTRLGIVVATPYSKRPPRFEYQLSDSGHALGDAIRLLSAWGAATDPNSVGPFHNRCATKLDVRFYCPTCDVVVGHPDETWL